MKNWISVAVSLAVCASVRQGSPTHSQIHRRVISGPKPVSFSRTNAPYATAPTWRSPRADSVTSLISVGVAGNPEMVIPERPDESEFWVLVHRDEMPPADRRKAR